MRRGRLCRKNFSLNLSSLFQYWNSLKVDVQISFSRYSGRKFKSYSSSRIYSALILHISDEYGSRDIAVAILYNLSWLLSNLNSRSCCAMSRLWLYKSFAGFWMDWTDYSVYELSYQYTNIIIKLINSNISQIKLGFLTITGFAYHVTCRD